MNHSNQPSDAARRQPSIHLDSHLASDAASEAIAAQLDHLSEITRASAPAGLEDRLAQATLPLLMQRPRAEVIATIGPETRTRSFRQPLRLAAAVALLVTGTFAWIASRPGSSGSSTHAESSVHASGIVHAENDWAILASAWEASTGETFDTVATDTTSSNSFDGWGIDQDLLEDSM